LAGQAGNLRPRAEDSRSGDRSSLGTVELAGWQREIVDRHIEEFVRGLIHSDGCWSMNRVRRPLKGGDRWYEYLRYSFTNVSLDIQRLFTDALDRLGIA
jgi:hypothetical protein